MKLRVTVEGKAYEVEVEVLDDAGGGVAHVTLPHPPAHSIPSPASTAPAPSTPSAPAAAAPSAGPTSGHVVVAPIIGTVLQVKVAVGDAVELNQVLLVLEAMKMETNVASPLAGKVKAVHVNPGQAVKAGQVLVEFE